MTKTEFAKAVAAKCPLEDGSTYAVSSVQKIIDAIPKVVLDEMAKPEVTSMNVPGLVALKKTIKKSWTSAITKETYPDTPVLTASINATLKKKFKSAT